MQRIEGKNIHVRLPQELLDELDRVKNRLGLTQSEMIRNSLDISMEIFRAYEAVGIVKIVEVSDRISKTLKRSVIGQKGLFNGEN